MTTQSGSGALPDPVVDLNSKSRSPAPTKSSAVVSGDRDNSSY